MKTITAALLVLALALASACGPRVDDPADVQAITQLMEGYFKSASAKDPAALQAVLSDQTILFEPHMAPLAGKDAIGKMHESFMGQFGIDAKGPVAGVRVAGDLAVAHGSYRGDHHPEGRNPGRREGERALDGRASAAGRRRVEVGVGDGQQRPAHAGGDGGRGRGAGAARFSSAGSRPRR